MMAQARDFASMLAAAAISCQALHMLVPRGALEKPLRMLLSVFFLCCLLAPLREPLSWQLPRQALEEQAGARTQQLQDSYSGLLEEAVRQNIRRIVEARLQKMGAEGTNILVNVHAGEDGRIDISEIIVTLSEASAGMAGQVKGELEAEMELPVDVLTGPEVQSAWS